MKVRANGIQIEVEDTGDVPDGQGNPRPVVMLIMGLGMQLVHWPSEMVQALVDAGYRVVRIDNRDVGLSQHMDHLGKANLAWAIFLSHMGLAIRPKYTLTQMARDAIGVLDALGIAKAHIVGLSMGGMISQRIAIAAPERVLSLTSIMSHSGAKNLPAPSNKVLKVLLARPRGKSLEAIVDHYVRLFRVIGSPVHPMNEAELRAHIRQGIERNFDPSGVERQLLAIVSDDERASELSKVMAPTLVVHGNADPLVPIAAGEDTARRIKGARMVSIDGMGHDLPPVHMQKVLDAMLQFFHEVTAVQ